MKSQPTTVRRHRFAPVLIVLLGLTVTGVAYAVAAPTPADSTPSVTADDVEQGSKLFAANCATCHGMTAEGTTMAPSLVGVGAAAVDFQVSTGRMPMTMNGPQAEAKDPVFTREQILQMAAFVATLGAGPAIPTDEQIDTSRGNAANGMSLFRTNCAMCHAASADGGALSAGKYAPSLLNTEPRQIFEAMQTGPQSMPVFNSANLSDQDKLDVITYIRGLSEQGSPGGADLGGSGPVSEGLVAWVLGLGLLVGCAVWLGAKAS